MEIVALESDGKQIKWSGKGIKRTEIVQKIFFHFFDYGVVICDSDYNGERVALFSVQR